MMRRFMSLFLVVVSVAALLGTKLTASAEELCTPSGIEYSQISDRLDSYIDQYEVGLVSCEVAVFDGEGLITSNYYGYADLEEQTRVDEGTVYEWGSCSKVLVWVSVMQQWEQGNLDLDADIREYLPEGFLKKLQYKDEKVTMKNLMSHNAGFQESFYENQMCDESDLYDSLENAVKACECYQAYHVGEYTAYSNYGTALAAYIVERVSGQDYAEYVRENIFKPLGMEHTTIDPHMNDNEYVKNKRAELKCYYRGADPSYNEDYGICHDWVQLYPAGSVIGTLDDFARFGIALVSSEHPLFTKDSTRDEMYSPTSFYGDSDIAKNCHGLWTTECKVQTLGHAGNTSGCSSMLQFDPVSGLGVVVMTNEPGETMFNYGIPNLLFGEITDRPDYANIIGNDENDISGIYVSQRSITTGAMCFQKYMGGLFPIKKNEEGTYNLAFGGLKIDPDNKLIKIGENQYLLDKNGMKTFMYYSDLGNGTGKLEMMPADIITSRMNTGKIVFLFFTLLLGAISSIIVVIKLISALIAKLIKKEITFNKQVIATQIIYGITVLNIMVYVNSAFQNTNWFMVLSTFLAEALGVSAVINGVVLLSKTIREKESKVLSRIGRYLWGALSVLYFLFIITFQFYKYWTL